MGTYATSIDPLAMLRLGQKVTVRFPLGDLQHLAQVLEDQINHLDERDQFGLHSLGVQPPTCLEVCSRCYSLMQSLSLVVRQYQHYQGKVSANPGKYIKFQNGRVVKTLSAPVRMPLLHWWLIEDSRRFNTRHLTHQVATQMAFAPIDRMLSDELHRLGIYDRHKTVF